MNTFSKSKVAFKILLFLLAVFALSWWQLKRVPNAITALPSLFKEPIQSNTQKSKFSLSLKNHTYLIEPVQEYEIWGLVVSDHNSNAWWDFSHESWNDFINTKDICVIWGTNLTNPYFSKLNFSHGAWTCYVETKDSLAWQNFKLTQISNNHLIPADYSIQKQISQAQIGDQIRIKGQLVNYNVDGGPFRKSSLIRTDTNNGACEIIYAEEFEILSKEKKHWADIYFILKFLIPAVFIIMLYFFFTDIKNNHS